MIGTWLPNKKQFDSLIPYNDRFIKQANKQTLK